jgi:hypothetical protein
LLDLFVLAISLIVEIEGSVETDMGSIGTATLVLLRSVL